MNKYRLLKMNSRGGRYYAEEIATGLRRSLKTADREAAGKLLHALNESHRNPHLNQLMGQAYLAGSDPQALTRTWQDVLAALIACGMVYRNTHEQKPIPQRTVAFLPSPQMSPSDVAGAIVHELDRVEPDNCLFFGYQMASRAVVGKLCEIARTGHVRIVVGDGPSGRNQLADEDSPLRKLPALHLIQIQYRVNTQALLAFNRITHEAVCFVGSFPFDQSEASRTENMLVAFGNYDLCEKIYEGYDAMAHMADMNGVR